MSETNRIEIMHGVNLDQLGRRDPAHYGALTLTELELRIADDAADLDLRTRFFQTNHEGEFIEHLGRHKKVAFFPCRLRINRRGAYSQSEGCQKTYETDAVRHPVIP